MKIGIADNNGLKFCQDLKEHWEKKGHEVKYERGASEYLAQWADLYYVDQADNNVAYLYKLYHGDTDVSRPPDWDNRKKPIIAVRALDWDIWIRHTTGNQEIVDWVDKWICIAPHLEKELRRHADFDPPAGGKLKIIRPGVNLEKFTLKVKKTDGFQLGMVLGDMWWPKNHMAGLDIFTTLYRQDNRWRFHIRGQHEEGTDYWKIMYEYYLDSRGIREAVTLYSQLENMNSWYENIDILLHPGMKEGFCYAIGEAMAKGIPAVINDFYGSEDIWKGFTYQTHEQVINIINTRLFANPEANRNFIKSIYSLERQLKETDEWLGIP